MKTTLRVFWLADFEFGIQISKSESNREDKICENKTDLNEIWYSKVLGSTDFEFQILECQVQCKGTKM